MFSGKLQCLANSKLPGSTNFDRETYGFIFCAGLGHHVVVIVTRRSNLGFK